MDEQITKAAEEMIEQAKKVEMPQEIKDIVVENLNKSQEGYVKFAALAKEASRTCEGLVAKAQSTARTIGDRLIDNTEKNSAAAFENVKAVMGCKDVQEAVKMQAAFAQEQFGIVNDQVAELIDLSTGIFDELIKAGTKAVNDTAEQLKSVA